MDTASRVGYRYVAAEARWGLGQAHHTIGDLDRARACWYESIGTLHDLGVLSADEARARMRQPVPDTPEIVDVNT